MHFCIRCGIENTSCLHNSCSMTSHSTDKLLINCFIEHIRRDFNLLSVIDHKCLTEFMSGILAGHLSVFALMVPNFV